MKNLLDNLFLKETEPERTKLVRTFRLPEALNPLESDRVALHVVAAPGEAPFHKWAMAREGILDGIRKGLITPETTVVEATSGNTGLAMAAFCNALGIEFRPVMSGDVPTAKVDAIRVLGNGASPILHHDKSETTAEHARRLGAQDGWYNPDQYTGSWNPEAHYEHLAPQIFSQVTPTVFFTPGGTMGTCLGVDRYAKERGAETKVVPVMCAPGEEVPAVRTLARVKRDVKNGWETVFAEEDIELAERHESFLASFRTWRHVPVQLGPSFGLALAGALRFLKRHREAGTLDQFRDTSGEAVAVIFGPDDNRPYVPLYLGELHEEEFSGADSAGLFA